MKRITHSVLGPLVAALASCIVNGAVAATSYSSCGFPPLAEPCYGARVRSTVVGMQGIAFPPQYTHAYTHSASPVGQLKVTGPSPGQGSIGLGVEVVAPHSASASTQVSIMSINSLGGASANLLDGTLRASYSGNGSLTARAYGLTDAFLYDVITLTAPASINSFSFVVSMAIDGEIVTNATVPALPSSPLVDAGIMLNFTSGSSRDSNVSFVALQGGKYNTTISTKIDLSRPAQFAGPEWGTDITLEAYLRINTFLAQSKLNAIDFGNTARLSITLPELVSYTSASGVFLTSPVPEPASIILLSVGGIILGARHKRRRA